MTLQCRILYYASAFSLMIHKPEWVFILRKASVSMESVSTTKRHRFSSDPAATGAHEKLRFLQTDCAREMTLVYSLFLGRDSDFGIISCIPSAVNSAFCHDNSKSNGHGEKALLTAKGLRNEDLYISLQVFHFHSFVVVKWFHKYSVAGSNNAVIVFNWFHVECGCGDTFSGSFNTFSTDTIAREAWSICLRNYFAVIKGHLLTLGMWEHSVECVHIGLRAGVSSVTCTVWLFDVV